MDKVRREAGIGRRIGWGVTGAVITASAVVTIAAPTASSSVADATWIVEGPNNQWIYQDTPNPVIQVGTIYALGVEGITSASPTTPNRISFYDNGQCIGAGPIHTYHPDLGIAARAFVSWVPTSVGTHTFTAQQGSSSVSWTVTVSAAADGSTPAVQPAQPACDAVGTGSTGSAGF
ncbi:hypothetical protein [Nocardia tengchongensis]|uniref:hypothetical protein n=1 Tax=Nocardia tengchongensis TaxID=2055889 RepID=UPI00366176DF